MASKVTIVNPWHWLDEDGRIPADGRVRGRAIRVAQCIEYGGTLRRGNGRMTLIPCRRRPGGTACPGLMVVLKQSDDAILAFCDACTEEEFLIYEWEDTFWAKGQQRPIDPVELLGTPLNEPPTPGPERRDEMLAGALDIVGSGLDVSEVRRLVATAASPNEVIHAIVASCIKPVDIGAMQRLLPIMIDVWNETPRPELGGRRPVDVHEAPERRKVGRNAPCPCGSGRKYKRCCGAVH